MLIMDMVDIPIWLITLTLLLAAVYLYTRLKHSLWRRLGVPGPEPTPFLGILSLWRRKGRIQADLDLVEEYGKIIGVYLAHQPSLIVADPELVKRVMVKDFTQFPNRHMIVQPAAEFRKSLLFTENEHWRFVRNTLSPTFTAGKLKDMNPLIEKCYIQLLENMERQSMTGKPLDMKQVFGGYTMDVIASTAFGMEVDSQKDPNNKFVKSAKAVFEVSITSIFLIFRILLPQLGKLAVKLNLRPQTSSQGLKFLQKAVISAIEMRKTGGNVRNDFLDLALNAHKEISDRQINGGPSREINRGLSLDEITANSILFFIAGYDTTANTLSFMAYNLAVHPECQDKVIKEIDEVIGMDMPNYENAQQLKYMDMVMSETLRLHGPVFRINRKTESEIDIAGYKIPKNTEIVFPIFTIHRDPSNWPEPEKFDPERFTPENTQKRHPYSYMPFGHGPRKCIGMRLAQMEIKTAMVYILQRYRFVKCDETEVPITYDSKAPVLRAKNGIKLKLKSRK